MSKGGGSQTVTNVQALPPAIEAALGQAYTDFNPFSAAFGAVSDFNPQAYSGQTMADLGGLQQSAISAAEGLANRPSYLTTAQQGLESIAQGNTGIGFDPTTLAQLQGAQADLSGLQGLLGQTNPSTQALADLAGQTASLSPLQDLVGATNPALGGLQNLTTASADTSQLQNLVGQENAATGLLTGLAGQSTNPFLQQQLANAVEGAVNQATSQYALGGRLGSDSFAGALGAGITNAALPTLSQNLQQDQANQLAAAQALGQVSGQQNQQQINLANTLLGAQQQDQAQQLAATQALGQLANQGLAQQAGIASDIVSSGQQNLQNQLAAQQAAGQLGAQNFGQQADIAQNLAALQQSGIGQQAGIAQDLAALQLSGSQASTQAQQAALGQLPSLLGADQQIISTLQNVGALQQAPAQALLDAAQQQQQQQNILDQNQINALLSAAGMGSGLFGQTTTQTGGGPSALQSGLGGALTGASLGGLLPAVGGPLGAAIGGGLGLLGIL